MADEPELIRTQKEAAALLGVTSRQLRNWANEDWFPQDAKSRKGWNIAAIKAARDEHGRKGSDESKIARRIELAKRKQQLKRERIRVEREQFELDRQRGEFIPREAVELFASTLLMELSDWCEQFPDLMANAVPAKARKAFRQRMKDELRKRRQATRDRLEREAKQLDQQYARGDA